MFPKSLASLTGADLHVTFQQARYGTELPWKSGIGF